MQYPKVFVCAACLVALSSAALGAEGKWLTDLDPSKPNSLCLARERFLLRFPITSPDQAKGLFELWDFYDASISANQGVLNSPTEGLNADQFMEVITALRTRQRIAIEAMLARLPSVKQRMAPYLECGYTIVADFDDTVLLDSGPHFFRAMEDHIQPALRDYIELYLTQNPNWLDYDGGLAIPLDRLRSRIGRWEKLRNENRTIGPLISHLDTALRIMFEIYLCGLDNFSLFDDHGQMAGYARDSYEQFLKLNTGSREYELVASALANMKHHDWQLNRELIQLYGAHGYSTEHLKSELNALHR